MGTIAIRLDEELIQTAKSVSSANFRSLPKQVEYWALMGRIGEENPELNFEAIKAILQGIADLKEGNVKPFVFNRPRTQ
ncbi:MAG: hypothetical protein HQM11_01420 [SAR324 cluster bacterium]|nr:hypothetical protein [SAR324 cluster bacterium]